MAIVTSLPSPNTQPWRRVPRMERELGPSPRWTSPASILDTFGGAVKPFPPSTPISSLHPRRMVGEPEAVKVQLERKHSPEAEGICRFMAGAARSLWRSRLLPRPCLHPSSKHPRWAHCLLGLLGLQALGGEGPEGGSSSSRQGGPSSAEPPWGQGLLPSQWPNPVGLRILGSSNLPTLESFPKPLVVTGSCVHQPKAQNSKVLWALNYSISDWTWTSPAISLPVSREMVGAPQALPRVKCLLLGKVGGSMERT